MTASLAYAADSMVWGPHPGFQTAFLESPIYELLGGGAAGPGKTDALIADGVEAANHPSGRGLLLRSDAKDLVEIQDRLMLRLPRIGAKWKGSPHNRWQMPGGGTLTLGHGATLKEVSAYLGRELTWLGYDQLDLLPEERLWTLLMARLRSTDPTVRLRARATANPGGLGHGWIKRRFIDSCGEDGYHVVLDAATGLTRGFLPGRAKDNPSLPETYWRRLNGLPEPYRSWYRDGNWSAGQGLALRINRALHLVGSFEPPHYWHHFAGFDWGFAHPFACAWAVASEDGDIYVADTIWGQGLIDSEIADRITSAVPVVRLSGVYAGHDCWHEHKARIGSITTTAEIMVGAGIPLVMASTDRVPGLKNLRRLLAPREMNGLIVPPILRFMDTPGNRRLVAQLEEIVTDPNHPEDALKVNAVDGQGGDDGYDALRYLAASRPAPAEGGTIRYLSTSDPAVLTWEAERSRQVSSYRQTTSYGKVGPRARRSDGLPDSGGSA